MNKSSWETLHDVALMIKDPIARVYALEDAEKLRIEQQNAQNELVGRYVLAKFFDIIFVILTLITVGIVIMLFKQSLFKGFISFIGGVISIKFLCKQRSSDLFSYFSGWF